jgi:hypothetical protein
MQSFRQKPSYSFRVDANALDGIVEEPFHKVIPTVAPVSLPEGGGFVTARSEAFNLDEIVSCSSAYSRVSGTKHADGSISILTTAVVEDLNLLEVVTAERVVAQVSISIPAGSNEFQISLTGSRFEGLWLAGRRCQPTLNSELIPPGGLPFTWQNVQKAGQSLAKDLIAIFKARGDKDAEQWAQKRHGWMTANPPPPADGGELLCSLVNGVDGNDGHIVEIPGFGRIFLGELRVSHDSVQLVAIRAELGCPVEGKVGICTGGGGGQGER